MRQNPDGTLAVTKVVHLEETGKYPEFNVKVIRDEAQTLSQPDRYRPEDICIVPSRHDSTFNGHVQTHFQQVSLAIAAAMTCHKVQGLTIPQIYFCLHQIWGFGIPYTAFTRTPFKKDIAIVGVPPRDIFAALFFETKDTPSMVQRKRREIDHTLLQLEDAIDADIKAGLIDLTTAEEKLVASMTTEDKADYSTLPAEARATQVKAHLMEQRRDYLTAWRALV